MNRYTLVSVELCCFLAVFATQTLLRANNIYLKNGQNYCILSDTNSVEIICPQDTVLYLPKGHCSVKYTYSVTALSGGDTLSPIRVSGLPSGADFPFGITENHFKAFNTQGDTASCTFTVEVQLQPLSVACPETATVYLGPECWTTVRPEMYFLEDSYHSCPEKLGAMRTDPLKEGPAFFDSQDLGLQNFYIVLIDSLLEQMCLVEIVEVRDTVPPTLACVDLQIPCLVPREHLTPTFLRDSLGIAEGYPNIYEGCPGDVSVLFSDVYQAYPCDSMEKAGLLRRFWTVVDAQGNFSTCIQRIELVRDADSAVLPADTTVLCSASTLPEALGRPFFQVGERQYFIGDSAVCGIGVSYEDALLPECGGRSGLMKRLWTVYDTCRLNDPDAMQVGEQVIERIDTLGPIADCPPIVGATLLAGGCSGPVELPGIVVTDHCSPVVRAVLHWNNADSSEANLTPPSTQDTSSLSVVAVFDTLPDLSAGLLPMRLLAYDSCGNAATCLFSLDVRDQTPPTAKCKSTVTVLADSTGAGSISASMFDDGSEDDCRSAVQFKVRRQAVSACDTIGYWDDRLTICCADVGHPFPAVVRVYDAALPMGPVSDTIADMHFAECTTTVEVLYDYPPSCQAPPDTIVVCAEFDPTLDSYGIPVLSCGLDAIAVELDTSLFQWSCGIGTLVRTFRVFDSNGQSSTCSQRIIGVGAPRYFIRFPDDVEWLNCRPPIDTSYRPVILGEGCEDVVISFTDSVEADVLDACLYIVRTWTVYNRCTYDPTGALIEVPNPSPSPIAQDPANSTGPIMSAPGTTGDWSPSMVAIRPGEDPTDYSAFWSADANGYQYVQYIKVVDGEEPTLDCPTHQVWPDITAGDLNFWSSNGLDICEAEVNTGIIVTDNCSADSMHIRFELFLDLDGNGTQETAVRELPVLPPGTLKYNNVNGSGEDFSFDNRNIPADQKYRFVLLQTTRGDTVEGRLVWKALSADTPLAPKLPRGIHRISWEITDRCGNVAACSYTVQVGDPPYSCAPYRTDTIRGEVQMPNGQPLPSTFIEVSGTAAFSGPFTLYSVTGNDGLFSVVVPGAVGYTVTPTRNIAYLDGVTTFDLLLINKHILNIELLPTPYRIIAADANSSRTITTFDLLELRKLILGIYDELPQSPSWRFVPAAYVFPDPQQPFAMPFPERIASADSIPIRFIGIKVGDVNGSATGLGLGSAEDRALAPFYWEIEDRSFEAGEVFDIALRGGEAIAGIQGTLEFSGLQVLEIPSEAGFDEEHCALWDDGHRLTFSWDAGGTPTLRLRVRALRSGRLSERMFLTATPTPAEAYSNTLDQTLRPTLRFLPQVPAGEGKGAITLHSWPNPFADGTQVSAYFPEETWAHLRLCDASGRVLWERASFFPAGTQVISIGAHELRERRGVLLLSLETARTFVVHRLLRF